MNLMSSTLLVDDTGVPFDELQAEQIARFRAAWSKAGWPREPRISISRSVLPIVTDLDRRYFGDRASRDRSDQVGYLEGTLARFGKSYIGEPDVIAAELSADAAVREADTLLLTVPNQLGVEYNTRLLETFARWSGRALEQRLRLHAREDEHQPAGELLRVGCACGPGPAEDPAPDSVLVPANDLVCGVEGIGELCGRVGERAASELG
jgi:hypothetical protein